MATAGGVQLDEQEGTTGVHRKHLERYVSVGISSAVAVAFDAFDAFVLMLPSPERNAQDVDYFLQTDCCEGGEHEIVTLPHVTIE